MFREINRRLRGHRFYPTATELKRYPKIYGQEGLGYNAIVHVHYFSAGCDWWITEFSKDFGKDPDDPNNLLGDDDGKDAEVFGYTLMAGYHEGSWGYIDLREMERLNTRARRGLPIPLIVERDCYWTLKPLVEILRQKGVAA